MPCKRATLSFIVSVCLLGEGSARSFVHNHMDEELMQIVRKPNVQAASKPVVQTASKQVVEMSESTFQQSVLDPVGEEAQRVRKWVVLFHSKADAQSRMMMPSFDNMLARLLGRSADYENIGLAKVDCSSNKDLCSTLDVTKFPSVFLYQDRQVVATWTSGVTGLVPWLQKEISKTSKGDSQSLTLGVESLAEARQIFWQAIHASGPARRYFFEISHLEPIHDLIFMEDCGFARVLSFLLLAAILLKTAGIVLIDGAELRLSTFACFRRAKKNSGAAF